MIPGSSTLEKANQPRLKFPISRASTKAFIRKTIPMKRKRKLLRTTMLIAAAVAAVSIIYNVYDNHRFIVVEHTIEVEHLPQSFDGYKILQISDLHSRYFGEQQKNLLTVINATDYDMIAFTGDMNQYKSSKLEESYPILDLIDGIQNKNHAFWVDGNTGPFATETFTGALTGELTDIGNLLEEKGCTVLINPYPITKDGEQIWIVPEISAVTYEAYLEPTDAENAGGEATYQKILDYYTAQKTWHQKLSGNGQVKIMLTHIPCETNLSQDAWAALGHLDYSLILAGHYHGGQIRVPFYGALFIPTREGDFFPKQSDVKGLSDVSGIPQYISAGLGASDAVSFLNFRIFNTPEINLITLKCK